MNPLNSRLEQQQFLSQYWQQKPLLIHQAIPGFNDPVDENDLASLAMLDEVDARIIQGQPISTHHGPFSETYLQDFATQNSTLLVQSVDHYVPELEQLRQQFNFIPAWRVDDIMVSFATRNGGVGPHYDLYDVFLLQGKGSRSWRIGQQCDSNSATDISSGQKVLQHFETSIEYTLHSGDMLYIPPGWAHWGVALDNCITYSIGFRAPGMADLIHEWAMVASTKIADDVRLRDTLPFNTQPFAKRTENTNEASSNKGALNQFDQSSIEQLRLLLQEQLKDDSLLRDALGVMLTLPSTTSDGFDDELPSTLEELTALMLGKPQASASKTITNNTVILKKAPQAQLTCYPSHADISIYFNGRTETLAIESQYWVQYLCNNNTLDKQNWQTYCKQSEGSVAIKNSLLLLTMIQAGVYQLNDIKTMSEGMV